MTSEEILALDRFESVSKKKRRVSVSVFIVMRCNFNDQMMIEDLVFDFEENSGKPLQWIDPYLGRNPKNTARIAFAYADDSKLYFIEKDGDQRKLLSKEHTSTYYYTDDRDKTTIIATHIW